jgi:membrane protein implicated in regulation of membrane protease activity
MRRILAVSFSTVGLMVLILFTLSFQFKGSADVGAAGGTPIPQSVRPFDPRTDRVASDSTPELNVVGRPGVVLPNLCEQRAKSGIGGQTWTVVCAPAPDGRSAQPMP